MKVLDLGCDRGHLFEGWFGSEADYSDQLARGLLTCPSCHSANVQKRLSAPRLNLGAKPPEANPVGDRSLRHPAVKDPGLKGNPGTARGGLAEEASRTTSHTARAARDDDQPVGGGGGGNDGSLPQQLAALRALWRALRTHSSDVGAQFAEEARRMHYGEVPERPIHGQASLKEAVELVEEGILVVPVPSLSNDADGASGEADPLLPLPPPVNNRRH
jgi:hypothetical protein